MILSKLVVTLLTATIAFSARSRRKRGNSEDGFIPLGSNLTMDGVLYYYNDELGGDIDPHTDGPFVSAPSIERRNQQEITIDLQYCKARQFGYDNVFVAKITLQDTEFTVKVDTGSSDLWVSDEPPADPNIQKTTLKSKWGSKTGHRSRRNLHYKGKYRPKHGAWGLLKDESPEEGSRMYEDAITFGGVTIANYLYGTLERFTDDFKKQPYDGILGLAFPSLAFQRQQSVIYEMYGLSRIPRVFALHLAETGPKLFIGWLGDPALFDKKIEYYEVIKLKNAWSYWALDDGKIKVGKEVIAEALQTLIVSGTDMIFGPEEYVKKIYDKIETAEIKNGQWVFNCDLKRPFPEISFSWGGRDWTLTLDSFILFRSISENKETCLGAIQVMPEGRWPLGTLVLGNSFMMIAHLVFDQEKQFRPKLGMAPRTIVA